MHWHSEFVTPFPNDQHWQKDENKQTKSVSKTKNSPKMSFSGALSFQSLRSSTIRNSFLGNIFGFFLDFSIVSAFFSRCLKPAWAKFVSAGDPIFSDIRRRQRTYGIYFVLIVKFDVGAKEFGYVRLSVNS